jgi:hypothetical protein
MLKIKEINFGLVPTGPAMGTSALQIFFEEKDGEYEPDDYDHGKKWNFNKDNRMVDEDPRDLFTEFYGIIKENYEEEFHSVANGKQTCFLIYMSGVIDKPENFVEFNRFQVDLSNRVWNYQITVGSQVDKMKPPFSIFIGEPKFMSGKNQFYELFNSVYPIIRIEENKKSQYNLLALQECFNGPFSIATIFYYGGELSDILELTQKFRLPGHKILIIDVDEKKENVQEFAKTNFFRYFPYLKGKNFLEILN